MTSGDSPAPTPRDNRLAIARRFDLRCGGCNHEFRCHAKAAPHECCEDAERTTWHCGCKAFEIPSEYRSLVAALAVERTRADKFDDEAERLGIVVGELESELAVERAKVEQLTETVENLRLISNVNGDWNLKYAAERARADAAVAEAERLRALVKVLHDELAELRATIPEQQQLYRAPYDAAASEAEALRARLAAVEAIPHEDFCCAKGCPGEGFCTGCEGGEADCKCLVAVVRAALSGGQPETSNEPATRRE